MGRYREPDGLPPDYPDESARVVYIERPVKPDHAGHIMQALTLAILTGLGCLAWNYTTSMERRVSILETKIEWEFRANHP